MALRASSKKMGGDADITVITSDAPGDGGVLHGRLLIELVDAVIDPYRRPGARTAGAGRGGRSGPAGRGGAVLGMFHWNDRVADAMGAPLDEFHLDYRRKLGEKMGMTEGRG
jgi:hypothetical protein